MDIQILVSCVADVNTYWKSAPDMSVQTHTATIARHYAEQVLAAEIPACRWVKLACQMQLNCKRSANPP
jgi:hypothetical protein